MLNKQLHPDYQLTNVDHTLEMMDFDGSGNIDINEFFEVCKLYSEGYFVVFDGLNAC